MRFPNACNIFVETYHAAVSPCASVLSNERSGSRPVLASVMQKEELAGQCPSENWMKTTLNYLFMTIKSLADAHVELAKTNLLR